MQSYPGVSPKWLFVRTDGVVATRDYLLFYVNGQRYQISGETTFSSLSDFLRCQLQLTGTKVVCAEGDCGACTVLVGRLSGDELRYETVDSCIQFLYQLDGKHVVTVEGLKSEARLHPVQQALVEHHGSQCGFCTPGFVVALTGMFEAKTNGDRNALQQALTGNLCRCTGYLPILEAGLSLSPEVIPRLTEQYHSSEMLEDLRRHLALAVSIHVSTVGTGSDPKRRTFYRPRSLKDAVDYKAAHPEATIVSGATELGVLGNKKGLHPPALLSLTSIPNLDQVSCEEDVVVIGANTTWTAIEALAKEILPEFYKIIIRFGSPQIRNVATLAANVAHGSPIADSLPFLMIMDADLELVSRRGVRRLNINGFYRGYKVKDLAPDEIITKVFIPLPAADDLLRLYKVSRRNDLDIATFGAGIRMKRAGDLITRAFIAYSGVAATVVRLPETEAFLQGKLFSESTFREAGQVTRREIKPITDVRGSRDFRLQLAENILTKFYFDCGAAEPESVEA